MRACWVQPQQLAAHLLIDGWIEVSGFLISCAGMRHLARRRAARDEAYGSPSNTITRRAASPTSGAMRATAARAHRPHPSGQLLAPFALSRIKPGAIRPKPTSGEVRLPPSGSGRSCRRGRSGSRPPTIGAAQLQLRVDHQHAARRREDDRQPLALAGWRLNGFSGFAAAAGHVVEGVHRETIIARRATVPKCLAPARCQRSDP
jgi:hypothetical protein